MAWLYAIAIVLFSLVALNHSRRLRERRLLVSEVQNAKLRDENDAIGIFDIFWDLGANEFALEIMGHQGLLPERADDVPAVLEILRDRIREEGSYAAFIRVTGETIEEFEREHRSAGSRRLLPSPQIHQKRLVSLGPEMGDRVDDEHPDRQERARALENRTALRIHRTDTAGLAQSSALHVDIDEVGKLRVAKLFQGLIHGTISSEMSTWWSMRKARDVRKGLDRTLVELSKLLLDTDGQLIDLPHLFDVSDRWQQDMRRIERLLQSERFADRRWRDTAITLLQTAQALAEELSVASRRDGDQLLAALRNNLERGEYAMAGYLAHLNRYALFSGQGTEYVALSTQIDAQIYRLQEELRAVQATRTPGK